MPINTCKQCGNEFRARTKGTNYCPGKCSRIRERAYGIQHRAKFSHERRRAVSLTNGAIERGELKPQPCEVCGTKIFVVAHHDDYAKPLDIRWLCRSDHKIHHVQHGPGRNT